MLHHAGSASARAQRGAIGLLAMGVLGLVILCLVLALDVGRLYYEKARLQKLADTAAMEAAAALARTQDMSTLREMAAANLARSEGDGAALTLQRGTIAVDDGINVFVAEEAPTSDAVRVVLRQSVPTSLIVNVERLFSDRDIEDTRTLSTASVARRTPVAALAMGTQLLSVDGDTALLQPVLAALGADLDLGLVGYEGLARTQVTLLELARELSGVGVDLSAASIDDVLNTTLTVGELADASLNILRGAGNDDALVGLQPANGAIGLGDVIAALENFTGGLTGKALDVPVRLGDLLAVDLESPQRENALFAGIGLDNLLSTALMAANRDSGIHLDDLDLNVGQLASLELDLDIIEPPQIAVGPVGCETPDVGACSEWRSEAKTAQLDLDVSAAVDVIGLVTLDLDLALESASASGGIESVVPLGNQRYDVGVQARSALLTSTAEVELSLLKFADVLSLSLDNNESSQTPTAAGTIYRGTLNDWPERTTLSFGEGIGSVSGLVGPLLTESNIELSLLGSGDEPCSGLLGCLGQGIEDLLNEALDSVSDLLAALTAGLDEVLDNVLAPLVDPLLDALGLRLNGVDADVLGVGYGKVELIRVGDPDA
ncbi:pilus assembly protein TadG-related protein [Chromohalobacter israelensis]|uniref:Membrane protein-like protein n=1 Tax=Chromohalobacter israelensis (strain ATCC BAA-138 / DSM 3043 / CIP 106854 / NCIMB 13768 / 1H11) TaxID=290398 RepID=Q1QWZ1_CHRI1|nr:pilus assembly protein TadG-related protein [Chromohalobacter salexigens]ABE59017.1 membrane protein-like protein [Chromohalobacter salexigens DSM 3043]